MVRAGKCAVRWLSDSSGRVSRPAAFFSTIHNGAKDTGKPGLLWTQPPSAAPTMARRTTVTVVGVHPPEDTWAKRPHGSLLVSLIVELPRFCELLCQVEFPPCAGHLVYAAV